mmetsp:Transcript_22089/g.47417  ORF Transcript_22089/g.47417 Transcript_22089/m.47417 type:complete len:240 (+) Transcript_22089:235-954(+)
MVLDQVLKGTPPPELVRNDPLAIVLRVSLQILHHVAQEVAPFHAAPDLVLQSGEVHVKVVKLRLVVHERPYLIPLDAVHRLDGAQSLLLHLFEHGDVPLPQVAEARDAVSLDDAQAVQVRRRGVAAPLLPRRRQRRGVGSPLRVDVDHEICVIDQQPLLFFLHFDHVLYPGEAAAVHHGLDVRFHNRVIHFGRLAYEHVAERGHGARYLVWTGGGDQLDVEGAEIGRRGASGAFVFLRF